MSTIDAFLGVLQPTSPSHNSFISILLLLLLFSCLTPQQSHFLSNRNTLSICVLACVFVLFANSIIIKRFVDISSVRLPIFLTNICGEPLVESMSFFGLSVSRKAAVCHSMRMAHGLRARINWSSYRALETWYEPEGARVFHCASLLLAQDLYRAIFSLNLYFSRRDRNLFEPMARDLLAR